MDLHERGRLHSPIAALEPQSGQPCMAHDDPPGYHAVSQQPEHHEDIAPCRKSSNSKFSVSSLGNWWVLELVALLFSAGLLVAIMVILRRHDNEPQPTWPIMSLNTMVSWLGTLSRALVLVPVTRSLGQLKWTWFASKPRAMSDLQTFDAAGRGVIESI